MTVSDLLLIDLAAAWRTVSPPASVTEVRSTILQTASSLSIMKLTDGALPLSAAC